MKILRYVSTLAVVLLTSTPGFAGLVAYSSFQDLMSSADVVVAGLLGQVEQATDSTTGHLVVIAPQYLKGTAQSGSLRIEFQNVRWSETTDLIGARTLLFLSRKGDGTMQLVPRVAGSSVFLRETIVAAASAAPPRLLEEDSRDTPMQKVIKEVASIQADAPDQMVMAIFTSLGKNIFYRDDVIEAFEAIRDFPGSRGRLRASRGIVALGSMQGALQLDTSLTRDGSASPESLIELEEAYASDDPVGIATLTKWLAPSFDSRVRASAAGALARVHTAQAVLALGPLLNDGDYQLRWRAIGGLSMFANNVPIGGAGPAPGFWPFASEQTFLHSVFDEDVVAKNEEKYLRFWRQWWEENSDAIAKFAVE